MTGRVVLRIILGSVSQTFLLPREWALEKEEMEA
ncbi:protein of unknown function [Methylocaldum szegediense]|uniref:Uncharacterized protein n=1 Tax=Methylocaldum szegediense TaxID=73780 RepID=A0ABM9I616_9GAMM|nr:protein of unknown function [Methylocaldum szegediense]